MLSYIRGTYALRGNKDTPRMKHWSVIKKIEICWCEQDFRYDKCLYIFFYLTIFFWTFTRIIHMFICFRKDVDQDIGSHRVVRREDIIICHVKSMCMVNRLQSHHLYGSILRGKTNHRLVYYLVNNQSERRRSEFEPTTHQGERGRSRCGNFMKPHKFWWTVKFSNTLFFWRRI